MNITDLLNACGVPAAAYAAGDIGPVGKRSTHIRRFFTDPWPRLP